MGSERNGKILSSKRNVFDRLARLRRDNMIDRIKLNENMIFLLSLPALSPPKGELCIVLSHSKDASA